MDGTMALKKKSVTKQKIPASFRRMRCVTLLWSRAYRIRFWLAKCRDAINPYVKQRRAIFVNERADRELTELGIISRSVGKLNFSYLHSQY